MTFARLEDRVARCANLLSRLGATRHKVCGLACSSPLNFLVARIALSRLQVCSISLRGGFTSFQIETTASHCGMTAIITDDDRNPASLEQIQISGRQILDATAEKEILKPVCGEAMDSIIVGSGSTGRSKYLAYTNAQWMAVNENFAAMMQLNENDVMAPLAAISSAASQRRSFAAFSRGATVWIATRPIEDLITMLTEIGATVVGATVWHTDKLLRAAADQIDTLKSVRMLEISGSTVSEHLIARVHKHLTPNAFVTFGANECTCVTMRNTQRERPIKGSVGRPLPGAQIEILNSNGDETKHGEIGAIRMKSTGMIKGYLNDPENTEKAFKNGWFYPGDVGKRTADGQIIHLGRSDNMMIFSGVNIHPAQIELVMADHGDVRDVAVLPFSHPVQQDIPICAVSLLDNAEVDESALERFGHKRLSNHSFSAVFIVPEIPRNAIGKLNRDEMMKIMRERWIEKFGKPKSKQS